MCSPFIEVAERYIERDIDLFLDEKFSCLTVVEYVDNVSVII